MLITEITTIIVIIILICIGYVQYRQSKKIEYLLRENRNQTHLNHIFIKDIATTRIKIEELEIKKVSKKK